MASGIDCIRLISSWKALCCGRSGASVTRHCVLLIDELDKVDHAFEALAS